MRRTLLTVGTLVLVPLLYAVAADEPLLITVLFEEDFYNNEVVVIPGGSLTRTMVVVDSPERWERTGVVERPDLLRPRGWKTVRKGDVFRFVATPVRDGVGELAVTVERTGQTRIFLYNESLEVTGERE